MWELTELNSHAFLTSNSHWENRQETLRMQREPMSFYTSTSPLRENLFREDTSLSLSPVEVQQVNTWPLASLVFNDQSFPSKIRAWANKLNKKQRGENVRILTVWEKKMDGNWEGEEMKKAERGRKNFFWRKSKSIGDISEGNNCGVDRTPTEPEPFIILCIQL